VVRDSLGQIAIGELRPGNGLRPFRRKGDHSGRHGWYRQVIRVVMSWHFDRPDLQGLASHNGCRASG